jgi:hypothetical protein
MITCFIKPDNNTKLSEIISFLFVVLPISFIVYAIYNASKMYLNKSALRDPNLANLFYKYLVYLVVYFIFALPLLVLLAISVISDVTKEKYLRWLSFVNFLNKFR